MAPCVVRKCAAALRWGVPKGVPARAVVLLVAGATQVVQVETAPVHHRPLCGKYAMLG